MSSPRQLLSGPAAHATGVPTCALGIMTKAPRPGNVKTRLVPPLSHDEAATLHSCFLKDTAENIAGVSGTCACQGIAVYTPVGTEPLFEALLPGSFRLVRQRGETLGERLFSATADILGLGYASVCLIDSDSPTLPSGALTAAVALLARPGGRVVLGPAEDGGYYLIGVKAAHHRLFADIAWSTAGVFAQTVERAQEARLDIEVLPRWYDVDDGPSLDRLCEELFGGASGSQGPLRGYHAPHTRGYLAQLLTPSRNRLRPHPHAQDRRSR
jgi:rSAM/selenodomain-associated transferase 1